MTTVTELRQRYEAAVKIARAERRMRTHVFRHQPEMMAAKVAEIDTLLSVLEWLKDELKPHCEPELEPDPQPEQGKLVDVPAEQGRRPEYR